MFEHIEDKNPLQVLGLRLKQVREYLNLTQTELSQEMGCLQNAVSNLENGKGGSITFLINLLNYYSRYVYIDQIFSNKFYLISNNEVEEGKKSNLNSLITQLILQAENNYVAKRDIIDSEFKKNLNKAIDLLS